MNQSKDKFIKLKRHPKLLQQHIEAAHELDLITKEEVQRIKRKSQKNR